MPYTTNPRMPKVRAKAVEMVRSGKSINEVARCFGYTKGAVSKWCKKAPKGRVTTIPTKSSRPHHHPAELPREKVKAIIDYKRQYKRCSEVIHQHLLNDGTMVLMLV